MSEIYCTFRVSANRTWDYMINVFKFVIPLAELQIYTPPCRTIYYTYILLCLTAIACNLTMRIHMRTAKVGQRPEGKSGIIIMTNSLIPTHN